MNTITKATIVTDGIVIEFGNTVICYFPASSLYDHRLQLKGQIFVSEDLSMQEAAEKTSGESSEQVAVSLTGNLLHQ